MLDKDIKNLIKNSCVSKGITSKDFEEKFTKVYQNMTEVAFDLPNRSTFNRWVNGVTKPDKKYVQIIAIVLEIDESQLLSDRDYEINKLERQVAELTQDLRIIQMVSKIGDYGFAVSPNLILALGLWFLNISTVQSIIAFIVIGLLFIYFMRKEIKEYSIDNQTEKDSTFEVIAKLIKSNGIIANIFILNFNLILFIFLLPAIELVFYRGKSNFVTSFIYILFSLWLYMIKIIRK